MLPSAEREGQYFPRCLDSEIDELLAGLRALAIDGPTAVGETETATRHCDAVLRLDSANVRQAYEYLATVSLILVVARSTARSVRG